METPAPSDPGAAETLDAIFRHAAARHGDTLALTDPPDRAAVMRGAPRQLSYAETARCVERLAAMLGELSLPRGAVVGLHLPNTVEAVVSFLAVLQAGLVPAPLPLLWRQAEATRALSAAGAKALIAGGVSPGAAHAELAMHLAAASFNVRFVCTFGDEAADDVVRLDGIWADDALSEGTTTAAAAHSGQPGDIAAITFDIGEDGPVAVPHSHAELMVAGLSVLLETGLPARGRIVSTMLGSSFAVLGTALVPWLLSGGTLALHHPFDAEALAAQLGEAPCDLLVAPGAFATGLAAGFADVADAGQGGTARHIAAVWRSPERQAASPAAATGSPVVDVLAFGEYALAALARDEAGRPSPLRQGALTAPSRGGAMTVLNVELSDEGTLRFAGPMIAAPPPGHDTGIACRADPVTGALTLGGSPPGIVSIGGYRFVIAELHDMVGRLAPDSVLAVLPHILAGDRLAGFAVDPAALRIELARRGVNPLVIEAFRDRPAMSQSPAA